MSKLTRKGMVSVLLAALIVGALAVPVVLATAAHPHWPPTLRIEGSTTTFPLYSAGSAGYLGFEALWPGTAIAPVSTGTGAGIRAMQALGPADRPHMDIAGLSRRPLTGDVREHSPHALDVWKIAHDAVAMIVNAGEGMAWLTSITRAEVDRIWEAGAGITTLRWSDVRAGWPAELVVPVAREILSGTRDAFHDLYGITPATEVTTFTHGGLRAGAAGAPIGNLGIVHHVRGHNWRIGYVGLAFIAEPGIRAVKIEGVMPSVATVRARTFPASRSLYLATLALSPLGGGLATDPTPNARAFHYINYMLTAAGQAHVDAVGFVSLAAPVVERIPAADVNIDGTVGAGDVIGAGGLRANWGTTSTHSGWIRADVNNDGTVNAGDVIGVGAIRANWGITWTVPRWCPTTGKIAGLDP